jgi:hypothetical protein
MESATKLSKAATEQAGTIVEDATGVATQFADRAVVAMRRAGAAAEDLYGQGTETRDYVIRLVVANPLPALLVAGAIGYTLASLMRR